MSVFNSNPCPGATKAKSRLDAAVEAAIAIDVAFSAVDAEYAKSTATEFAIDALTARYNIRVSAWRAAAVAFLLWQREAGKLDSVILLVRIAEGCTKLELLKELAQSAPKTEVVATPRAPLEPEEYPEYQLGVLVRRGALDAI